MEGNDPALVVRVLEGDRDAFRMLVERHSRSVFQIAYRMTGHEQDAEDVVQETFLRAYKNLRRYESRSLFSTWLYRIATNYSLDLMRSRKKYVQAVSDEDGHFPEIPAEGVSAEQMAYGGQVRQSIQRAMEELTAQERAAFVMRHYEGFSVEQISSALGVGENAAKHSVFRAVRKLRRALEPLLASA